MHAIFRLILCVFKILCHNFRLVTKACVCDIVMECAPSTLFKVLTYLSLLNFGELTFEEKKKNPIIIDHRYIVEFII